MSEEMGPDEKCVNAICDLMLASARAGTREVTRANYEVSLKLLEDYVRSELLKRSVARAVADNDADHMREAADILRTMTATADQNSPNYGAQPDLKRLSQWYLRDVERGTGL